MTAAPACTFCDPIVVAKEGGRHAGPNVLIDQKGGAYPSPVELRDGAVLCVYYEEGAGSSIRAKRLQVTRKGVKPVPFETP